jgi:hypothetical protein
MGVGISLETVWPGFAVHADTCARAVCIAEALIQFQRTGFSAP